MSACTSQNSVKNYSNPAYSSSEAQRVQTTEIEENTYRLRYNGLLKDSLQDAQDSWIKNAEKTCNGNSFTYKVTEQGFISDYRHTPAKVSADLSGLCITGGAVGCIIASIFSDGDYNSKSSPVGSPFAAVEGLVTCKVT